MENVSHGCGAILISEVFVESGQQGRLKSGQPVGKILKIQITFFLVLRHPPVNRFKQQCVGGCG
jgi:hypothetical protein